MTENLENIEKPKKGIFGKFVDSIFVSDEEQSINQPVVNSVQSTQPTSQPTISVTGTVNQEIYKKVKQVLEECNLPGPDYLELKNSCNAMASIIPDENARFLAAYATLKASTPSLTKNIILNSIDEYIKFINKEKVAAEKEIEKLFQKEVLSRKTIIDNESVKIEEFKKQIEKLQSQINESGVLINKTSSEMVNKQSELDIQKKNFETTVDFVTNELNTDKNKLQTLIIE